MEKLINFFKKYNLNPDLIERRVFDDEVFNITDTLTISSKWVRRVFFYNTANVNLKSIEENELIFYPPYASIISKFEEDVKFVVEYVTGEVE